MKITIENKYGTSSVEIDKEDINSEELFRELIIPVLMSKTWGYETIMDGMALLVEEYEGMNDG